MKEEYSIEVGGENMSSREDNNVNGNAEYEAYGVDDITELSAEEIEKLLAESTGGYAAKEPEDENAGDVLEMLEEAGENKGDDLRDIQDMLKRSDRNEAIEADAVEEAGRQENPVDKLLEDIEGASADSGEPLDAKDRKAQKKQQKSQEKMRLVQEKAEKSAKKKADKEAARAEKAAKRELRKRGGAKNQESAQTKQEEPEGIKEYDLLQDKDLLDSIVSKAEDAGHEKKEAAQNFSVNELGPEYDAAKEREKAQKTERIKEKNVGAEMDEGRSMEDSQSGIMELDMDEIDAFIPDISEGQKEQSGKQKGGLMNKIIKMLTEEEEPENENLMISDENMEILRDLDKEKKAGGKKAKKAKKPAKKKEQKKKAPKPAKPKKPKKVKEKEPYVPGRKLTLRKAMPILLLGATIGAVLFIFVNLVTDFSVKKAAEEAYKNGDYATCYQNLYGKKRNEEQAQMYGKAESILYMEQEYRKFDIVLQNDSEAEALDSLLQTVSSYPEVQAYAAQCQALPEVEEIYGRIIGILSDRYGLTESEAKEIAGIASSIEYTRTVMAVAEGRGYGSTAVPDSQMPAEDIGGDLEEQPEDGTEAIPDELPEEEELGEGNFVDNE